MRWNISANSKGLRGDGRYPVVHGRIDPLDHISVDVDIADAEAQEHPDQVVIRLRRYLAICRDALLDPVAAREPGSDDEPTDLGPGDSAYHRAHPQVPEPPAAPAQQQPHPQYAARRDEVYAGREPAAAPPPRRDAAPPPRQQQQGNGRDDGPPRNGRQFSGWIRKQDPELEERAKGLMETHGWGWKFNDLNAEETAYLFRELTAPADQNGQAAGNGRR